MIAKCEYPGCRVEARVSYLSTREGVWFCSVHKWAENMTYQEISVHLARRKDSVMQQDLVPDENSKVTMGLPWTKDYRGQLTAQQEAVIDKSAYAWTQDIEKVCTEPLRFIPESVCKIVAKAIKVEAKVATGELCAALDCISPLLTAFRRGDTRAMERLLKIINAARDKYPL